MYRIILASKSPRRRELLKQIGLEFEVAVSDDEEILKGESSEEIVMGLARQKAYNVKRMTAAGTDDSEVIIIGADTIVVCGDEILGKPKDEEDAVRMLSMLQNNSHEVYTGVCAVICGAGSEKCLSFYEKTRVYMYDMTRDEIEYYIKSGEPMDKAGAYGIQGLCARYIKGIEGDYNNVVGLPIGRLYRELKPYIS